MDGGYIIERLITAMDMISDIVVHIQTHMGKECVIYYQEVKQSQPMLAHNMKVHQ